MYDASFKSLKSKISGTKKSWRHVVRKIIAEERSNKNYRLAISKLDWLSLSLDEGPLRQLCLETLAQKMSLCTVRDSDLFEYIFLKRSEFLLMSMVWIMMRRLGMTYATDRPGLKEKDRILRDCSLLHFLLLKIPNPKKNRKKSS